MEDQVIYLMNEFSQQLSVYFSVMQSKSLVIF